MAKGQFSREAMEIYYKKNNSTHVCKACRYGLATHCPVTGDTQCSAETSFHKFKPIGQVAK